jgi:Flp pilus assembly protein protease CpaA
MYVAAALIFRTVMISAEGLAENDLLLLFVRSLAGLAAGGLVTGIAYAVSRKGIGAGDVKMFAAIGYFTGGFAVIDILVYSTLFCCVCGIVLIVFRKCKARDCLPMAPFAYAGTMLYLIAGM